MWWLLLTLPLALLFSIWLYLELFKLWYQSSTYGVRYFSRTLSKRLKFKRCLSKHAIFLLPIYRLLANNIKHKKIPAFRYKTINAPTAISNTNTFQQAYEYQPKEEDIFVVTAMKSGTTWMQNIVFELLHHGEGNFNDDGYKHLYATSPWLETGGKASIDIAHAPLISTYKKRLIKTHLPYELCPFNKQAKYIYVVRHPAKTFNSFYNFMNMLTGPFCPSIDNLLNMYCSDDMLWGSWPAHVNSWWKQAQINTNVLFIHYEKLIEQNNESLRDIALFLNIRIDEQCLQKVAKKTSLEYMNEYEHFFEMAPPNIFSVSSHVDFINKEERGKQKLSKQKHERIMQFCYTKIPENGFPVRDIYNV
jgi:hypothetical protein